METINSIKTFIPYYPSIKDPAFQDIILSKYEFSDIQNTRGENNILLDHQLLCSRLMSSHTNYDSMLFFHDMGTGKTCTSIAVIERILQEDNGITKCIYLSKGPGLGENFIEEYLNKCTVDKYADERLPHVKTFTFGTFYKTNKSTSSEILKSNYSNSVIVIDEVHNIRDEGVDDNMKYDFYNRFLHSVANCKILLLSGTPMKNAANEIVSIMNLILSEPIPSTVFKGNLLVDPETLTTLIKGKVSYIKRKLDIRIRTEFIGKILEGFKHFILSPDYCTESSIQHNEYDKIYKQERFNSFKNKTRQIILCAAETDDDRTKIKNLIRLEKTVEEKLSILKKYSSKYAESISDILTARRNNKSVFVYNKYVNNNGLVFFSELLMLFGFSRSYGDNKTKGNRFVLITGTDTTGSSKSPIKLRIQKSNSELINAFNSPDNYDGSLIGVILGSPAISEGYTFKNIQVIDIHTPWYNYSETSQVIARGIRFGSHDELLKKSGSVNIQIFQRCTLFDNISSVDTEDYQMAEGKDIDIKKVERILKVESIDCELNYIRNRKYNINGSRDCEYDTCDYTCFPGSGKSVKLPTDYTTFNLYFSSHIKKLLRERIILHFETNFSSTLQQIINTTNTVNIALLLEVLNDIIDGKITIYNIYNIPCILCEQNDLYFISTELYNDTNDAIFYTVDPVLEVANSLKPPKINIESDIRDIFQSETIDDLLFSIRNLTKFQKQWLFEGNILRSKRNKMLMEYFTDYYMEVDDKIYVWYLKDDNLYRKYDNGWKDCDDTDKERINKYIINIENNVKERAASAGLTFYGLINYDEINFKTVLCIKRLPLDTNETKKNRLPRGRTCISTPSSELKDILKSLNINEKLPDKKTICNAIFTYLTENNLVIRDSNCGKQA